MKQQKNNELALQLEYLNGNGEFQLPTLRSVALTEESQLTIEIILEEADKLPPKIRHEVDATRYKAEVVKLRGAVSSVEALIYQEKEPLREITKQIDGATKEILNDCSSRIKDYVAELTRWEELKREGDKREKAKLSEKKVEIEEQIKVAPKPQQAELKHKLVTVEAEIKKVEPKTTSGIALIEYWEGQLLDAVTVLKSKHRGMVDVSVDQKAIDAYCKDLEAKGVQITPNMIPGLKLVHRTRSSFRG